MTLPLPPGPIIERTIKDINDIFDSKDYWLAFGGLWGIIRNRGIIPDNDFDICVRYGYDWKQIERKAVKIGYQIKKVMVDDTKKENALYMGIYNEKIYICISFWYQFKDLLFWCHDQLQEVHGIGTPQSGYFFKGIHKEYFDRDYKFTMAEWPGIVQNVKIRVPLFSGKLLDLAYPAWPYLKQRYVIKDYSVEEDKCVSVNDPVYVKGSHERATSRYRVHVKSMAEFSDEEKINLELSKSAEEWETLLKNRK